MCCVRGLLSGVAAFGAGAAGFGWYYSSVLLDPRQRPDFPEKVVDADEERVRLAVTRLSVQPGVWGLSRPGGLARVGPVLRIADGVVDRSFLGGDRPAPGTAVMLDAAAFGPDPGAVGLEFEDVLVPGPLGDYPAWSVPARANTWVVLVHGRGGDRREALRVLPALHELGLSTLDVSYRNDEGAPPSPDGRYHLGDTEWVDVEAAVRWAKGRGAEQIVLYGWSMGGAITGAFLDRSAEAAAVAAVVWDAPLLDWRATLRQQARIRRLPAPLTPLATAATSRRIGIDFDRFDLLTRPPAVRPPTLVIHSTDDTAVPIATSRALVAAAPDLDWPMRYVEVEGVEHTASWNADPARYERAVTSFLAEVLRTGILVG